MKFNDRETATVLAALRHLQQSTIYTPPSARKPISDDAIHDIATDMGKLEPLTDDEIDSLCSRINMSTTQRREATEKKGGNDGNGKA